VKSIVRGTTDGAAWTMRWRVAGCRDVAVISAECCVGAGAASRASAA
jgi:hypothetical protein